VFDDLLYFLRLLETTSVGVDGEGVVSCFQVAHIKIRKGSGFMYVLLESFFCSLADKVISPVLVKKPLEPMGFTKAR